MTEHELWEENRKINKRLEEVEQQLLILKDNAQVLMDRIFELQQAVKKETKEDGDRS